MANYLVTGGCGFIGSHLVDSLISEGHTVRVIDDLSSGRKANIQQGCELVIGDVTDTEMVLQCMAGMDGCYHLASVASIQQSIDNWLETHNINLTGAINVFNAARQNKIPVVYASSSAVYGDNADIPLKESAEYRPLTAIGADNLATELHARVATLVHGVPTVGMRFFNVYGPRQNPLSPYFGVVASFFERLSAGKTMTIYGDGEQTRDFVYIDDAVNALKCAMTNINAIPMVFNVCTGEAISINKLALMMQSLMGKAVAVENKKSRKGDIRVSIGNPERSKKILNFSPQITVMQGLRKLMEFETDNGKVKSRATMALVK